jgi:hypothetical protein
MYVLTPVYPSLGDGLAGYINDNNFLPGCLYCLDEVELRTKKCKVCNIDMFSSSSVLLRQTNLAYTRVIEELIAYS